MGSRSSLTKSAKRRNYVRFEQIWGWLFISPMMLELVVFLLIPLVASFVIGFTQWNLITNPIWVGFDNYVALFRNELFPKAIANTFILMSGIPVGAAISFLIAVMLKRAMGALNNVFKVLLYLPAVTNTVAVAITWRFMFNSEYGLINQMLRVFGVSDGPRWLSSPEWIKPAFLIMGIWVGLGSTMLMFLAALNNIPSEYYEAAEIDGASGFKQMMRISIPLCTPTIFYILVTGIIAGLQAFGQTYVMAPGGGMEYSAGTIVYFVWQQGMENMKMGMASAAAWLLGVVIFIITLIQFRMQRYWVHSSV